MWYFLPTHPLILNFYYFVNCYTLFLFVIIIIVYVYIYFLFFYFLSHLSSFLSLHLSFPYLLSPIPYLSHVMGTCPHHLSSIIFIFISLLPTHFPGFPFGLSIFFPFLGLTIGRPHSNLHYPNFWISSP